MVETAAAPVALPRLNLCCPAMNSEASHTEEVHIGGAAKQLGVTPKHLRTLEREGRVPLARRDVNGRIYSKFDIVLLRSMGVGSRPRELKQAEEVLGAGG